MSLQSTDHTMSNTVVNNFDSVRHLPCRLYLHVVYPWRPLLRSSNSQVTAQQGLMLPLRCQGTWTEFEWWLGSRSLSGQGLIDCWQIDSHTDKKYRGGD